jgi:hypothetical protein
VTRPSSENVWKGGAPSARSVPEVFRRALPLVQAAFQQYGVPEATAHSAENDLTAWFVRFCRRNPAMGQDALILALLCLACSFARGYAVRQDAVPPDDREMASLLRERPEAVAERIAVAGGIGTPRPRAGGALARLLRLKRPRTPRT